MWDGFVRVFHWSLVALFVISVITGKVGGNAVAWHMWSSYAILARWCCSAFFGDLSAANMRALARFCPVRAPFRFAKGLMGKNTRIRVGHNPVGGWMVLALLLLLATKRCSVQQRRNRHYRSAGALHQRQGLDQTDEPASADW